MADAGNFPRGAGMRQLIQQPIIPGMAVGEYDPRDTLILTERIRKKIDQIRVIRDQVLGKDTGFFDDQDLIIMALDRLPKGIINERKEKRSDPDS